MHSLINKLKSDYPNITFTDSESFYWSPKKKTVHYRKALNNHYSTWPLLHEVGHALLEHQHFTSDFELLQLEIEAWESAKQLAKRYGYSIEEDHIQDCLDTYRDWLYKRSCCPSCTMSGLQIMTDLYRCVNCDNEWRVSPSRKCRTYRMTRHK